MLCICKRLVLTLCGAILIGAPGPLHAAVVAEVEPNDTLATAQNLDGNFTLDFNENIGDIDGNNTSTVIPHVTVLGSGNNSFDYYSFTVPFAGALGIFDIDFTENDGRPIDLELFLFREDATFLAQNDDSPITAGALGSVSVVDPFIQHVFTTAGRHILAVGSFNSIPLSTGIGGTFVKAGDMYQLHVSVPEPSSAIPAAMALIALVGYTVAASRRNKVA